jgi:hypothetical protein
MICFAAGILLLQVAITSLSAAMGDTEMRDDISGGESHQSIDCECLPKQTPAAFFAIGHESYRMTARSASRPPLSPSSRLPGRRPKVDQNLKVSSPAPVTIVRPSGLIAR